MANQCPICDKTYLKARFRKKLRGKYNPTAKRKQKPNLQWMTLASGKRTRACVKCIKKLSRT